jgi:branched-chain amino acid transport system ATP-binding protein
MLAIDPAQIADPQIELKNVPFGDRAPVIVHHGLPPSIDLAATLALAQRVYIINNGHMAHEGTAAELRKQPEILQRYLGV